MSTKWEKMELITLVTKRASKEGQCKRDNTIRMKVNDYKDWGKRPIPSKINTKGKRSVDKDWLWKIPIPSRINTKRKIQKGSTDVHLLKRTIELEID